MSNKDIVLDIDGVLADFEGAFCERFGNKNRHMVRLESRYPKDADLIDIFVNFSPIYEILDILPTGFKIAKWCKDFGLDIHVVSFRPDYLIQTTSKWLKRNGIPFRYLSVDQTKKVDRIKRINPLFIVDDLLSVCEQAAQIGIPSFLVDWPWNQGDLPENVLRIKSFDDFLAKIESFLGNYDPTDETFQRADEYVRSGYPNTNRKFRQNGSSCD